MQCGAGVWVHVVTWSVTRRLRDTMRMNLVFAATGAPASVN